MSRGTVTFLVGLRGVGKSYHRRTDDNYKKAYVIDYEQIYRQAPESMDQFEKPGYVKAVAAMRLQGVIGWHDNHEHVIVECTGMNKTGQACIGGMASIAAEYGYECEVIYLKPSSKSSFVGFLEQNKDRDALDMLRAVYSGHPKWRGPQDAAYLPYVEVVSIDHADVMEHQEFVEEARERMENARIAQGG